MLRLRFLSFVLGLGLLAAAWLGLFERLVPGAFSAHMTGHMVLVALAAPLCALAVAGGRADPVRRWPAPFSAILASVVELLLVWAWHTPGLHRAARESTGAFALEQASFFVCGLWLWLSAFGGKAAERDERAGSGILALLLTSMHMTLLGALLALPPRPLYGHGPASQAGHAAHGRHEAPTEPGRAALGPLEDQHLGGAIMIVLGGASYMAGGLWLALGLVRQRARARGVTHERVVGTGPVRVARAEGRST
jgi:putative membrane protein